MTPPVDVARGEPRHVVIAGGGVAAFEALLALRELARHRVRITLISPDRRFLYRPVTVGEAFGRSEARAYNLTDTIDERPEDRFLWAGLQRVDPDEHVVVTEADELIPYDFLLVATGGRTFNPLPGATVFGGRPDVPLLRGLLEELVDGRARSVAFALTSERTWALPLYELALMTAAQLRDHGRPPGSVYVVTPEEEPLALFGPAAARAVEPMLRARGIVLRAQSRPVAVRPRALMLAGGGTIHVDRVVTLAAVDGPSVAGLPRDAHGFIPVDAFGRVSGCEDVYAAGDATTFPLKQGGLAAQQADAAAMTIAAALGAAVAPKPFSPVLRGLLMTGGAPLYLRAEPQRLHREATVAIEATPLRRRERRASASAGQPLWWPPAKVAGRYLSPYLATARPALIGPALLEDRVPVPGPSLSEAEFEDALELALLLADCDARWGDYRSALDALDAAEALQGSLPPPYEEKRRAWMAGHS